MGRWLGWRWSPCLSPLAGLAIGALLLISDGLYLRLAGGALLFGLVPGLALINLLFPTSGQVGLLPRVLLSVASSYVMANLTVLVLNASRMELTVQTLALSIGVVTVALVFWSIASRDNDSGGLRRIDQQHWLYVLVLVAVFCFFRFANLGYSELVQGDEMPILWRIPDLIAGRGFVLFEYPSKGPTEVLTALAFVLFGNGFNEFALRFPFALASVASGLFVYQLGREMFSPRAGFVSGLLLALEGIYLAVSRFQQYQGVVILAATSAIYCFWRGYSTPKERVRFTLLGSACFGFGCLTHYGGIIVLPALMILYLAHKRLEWKREILLLGACAMIVLVLSVPYYFLFFFSEQYAKARSYYLGRRLGWQGGVHNNIRYLLSYMVFPNSTYYVALMWASLLGALVLLVERACSKPAIIVAGLGFVTGLAVSVFRPGLLQVGTIDCALLLFIPLAAVIWLRRDLPVADRAVWLWFLTGFVILSFFSREPWTHWYVISPAWALLSGVAVDRVWRLFESRTLPSRHWVVWVPFALLIVLFGGFSYIFFIRPVPAYARRFPSHKSPLYWTPQTEKPSLGLQSYGVPRQRGWKVLGYLSRMGQIRGRFRTGSTRFADQAELEWYLGHKYEQDSSSRYVFYTLDASNEYPAEAIEQWYDLTGRVFVSGQPQILIYARKGTTQGHAVSDYLFEDYESLYEQSATLDERLRLDDVTGGSEKVYFRAAGVVEETSSPDDMVVFTDPRQVGLFSYHYAGKLPYHIPAEPMSPNDLEAWLASQPITGTAYVLFWASPGSAERHAWDSWLKKPGAVADASWHGNVGLAVWRPDGRAKLRLLQDSSLGGAIQLVGYSLSYVPETKTVLVTLLWAADRQPDQDYTVFTHLMDDQGRLLGQKDNPPVNGTMETSVWRTDKIVRDDYAISVDGVPRGEYWIEVGMYHPSSGERLPTTGQGATPDRSVRLPLSVNVY